MLCVENGLEARGELARDERGAGFVEVDFVVETVERGGDFAI